MIEDFLRRHTRPCPDSRISFQRFYHTFKATFNAEGVTRLQFLNTIIKAGVVVVPGRTPGKYIVTGLALEGTA